ncbi:MAG: hypothetical protein M1823_000264 [Watsoniomyces obsoletus]|nr:MAG: hypothetical protein M1823_000264 [Watsoniomyces obsoletus]
MRSTLLVALAGFLASVSAQTPPIVPLVAGVTGQLGDAAIVRDNPVGVTYQATLPETNRSSIRGFISGTALANGTGVRFTLDFRGFPSLDRAPYIYHIHDAPIPSNGNCTAALAHLDPYRRGEQPPCNATAPQTCQVGDLSGKHGNITSTTYSASYIDLYASTKSGIGAFFGNRSIVLHTFNTTRLTCANFTLVSTNGTVPTPRPTGGAGSPSPTGGAGGSTARPPPFVSGANEMKVSFTMAVIGGLMMLALLMV